MEYLYPHEYQILTSKTVAFTRDMPKLGHPCGRRNIDTRRAPIFVALRSCDFHWRACVPEAVLPAATLRELNQDWLRTITGTLVLAAGTALRMGWYFH
jgi:hypothetical protein